VSHFLEGVMLGKCVSITMSVVALLLVLAALDTLKDVGVAGRELVRKLLWSLMWHLGLVIFMLWVSDRLGVWWAPTTADERTAECVAARQSIVDFIWQWPTMLILGVVGCVWDALFILLNPVQ